MLFEDAELEVIYTQWFCMKTSLILLVMAMLFIWAWIMTTEVEIVNEYKNNLFLVVWCK